MTQIITENCVLPSDFRELIFIRSINNNIYNIMSHDETYKIHLFYPFYLFSLFQKTCSLVWLTLRTRIISRKYENKVKESMEERLKSAYLTSTDDVLFANQIPVTAGYVFSLWHGRGSFYCTRRFGKNRPLFFPPCFARLTSPSFEPRIMINRGESNKRRDRMIEERRIDMWTRIMF